MATKAQMKKAKRDLTYAHLREGKLSIAEIAQACELSEGSVRNMKTYLSGKNAPPGRKRAAAEQAETPETGQTILDFQESPAPVGESKGIVDSAFSSLKSMLGIKEESSAKKAAPALSAKLNSKQREFVEAASPTIALAAMEIAAWMWRHAGSQYDILAPDETVATRIMEPILRIYARHSNFLLDINPDLADAGASLLALGGYVRVSLALYREMRERDENDEYEDNEPITTGSRRRTYRAATAATESGTGDTGDRSADVRGAGGRDDQVNGRYGRHPGSVNSPNLTDKDARQYAALSRLTQLDFEHRARRSYRAR